MEFTIEENDDNNFIYMGTTGYVQLLIDCYDDKRLSKEELIAKLVHMIETASEEE